MDKTINEKEGLTYDSGLNMLHQLDLSCSQTLAVDHFCRFEVALDVK